jgi:hypothetical protein
VDERGDPLALIPGQSALARDRRVRGLDCGDGCGQREFGGVGADPLGVAPDVAFEPLGAEEVEALNDGVYRAGPEGVGRRSSSWGRVCPVLGSRPGGGCVSC